MNLTKILSVAVVSAVFSSVVYADSDISLYGGVQSSKDISGKSIKAPSFDITHRTYGKDGGFTSDTKLKYQTGDDFRFWDFEAVFGWQIGDMKEKGAIVFMPAGIGYRYIKFDKHLVVEGTYHKFDSTGSLYYKGGIEYRKDNFLLDKLNLTLGAYYQATIYTATWAKNNNSYNLGTGGSKELKYKPKGFETSAGLEYSFSDNFSVGFRAGYSKITDEAFTDGRKLYLTDGLNLSAGIKLKF